MRILHISSTERDDIPGSSDSNFRYTLRYPITDEKNVVLMRLSIPKTYYIVNSEDYFMLHEGPEQVKITMPAGNYSLQSFWYTLQTILTQVSPHNYTYQLTANKYGSLREVDTGKFKFSVGAIGPSDTQPAFVFGDTLYKQLGFNKNTAYQFVDNKLDAPNIYNMNQESVLYLHSTICKNFDDNILQEVYTDGAVSGNIIRYSNKTPEHYMKPIDKSHDNHFWFTLTDIDGHIINLNGAAINITLCLS